MPNLTFVAWWLGFDFGFMSKWLDCFLLLVLMAGSSNGSSIADPTYVVSEGIINPDWPI